MADEFRHSDTGLQLEQAEYENIAQHIFNSQATGDTLFADSPTQLKRLAIGPEGYFYWVSGGKPAWTDVKAIKLDDFAALDNNTDLNASTTAHGLMQIYPNTGAGKFLSEAGTWSVPPGGSAVAAPVMVAAVDSTAAEQAFATASGGSVCDGVNDNVDLAAVDGQNMILSSGTFTLGADWQVASNTRCLGQGHSTVIALNNHTIHVHNVDHVELGNFKITGEGDQSAMPAALGAIDVFITANHHDHYFHDIWNTATKCDHFKYYIVDNITMENVTFERCFADSPDGMGFKIDGETSTPRLTNVRYLYCDVKNAGIGANRVVDAGAVSWTCGFDFCEFAGLVITDMQAIGCRVAGAWESGFHFETTPTKTNVKLIGCSTKDCGQKTGSAIGFGSFTISGDITLIDCQDSSSYRSIWAYGNGTTILAKLELHNFRSFDASNDGIIVSGLTDPDKMTFIGGGVYNAGHYGIDASGGCPNLRFHDFEVIDPTCANNIANYFSGNNIGLYNCRFKSTGTNTGIYLLAGNDIIVTGCRISAESYAIWAAAGCTRPMSTNNNWYGSTTDADLTTATGEIVKGNVDKTGAWVA